MSRIIGSCRSFISPWKTQNWNGSKCLHSNPEEFEEEVERIDWDFVSNFWHIGILHDSIDYAPAEITSILLNSRYLDLTDEDLEYLIEYAAESGKTEHTACLLNYKNERNEQEE